MKNQTITVIDVKVFSWDTTITTMTVNEHIMVVYQTLIEEGAEVIVEEVNPCYKESEDAEPVDSQREIDIAEVDLKAHATKDLHYTIRVDLPNSFISMKKLNKLINSWEVFDIND